jgi:hypothetical protein
MMLAMFSLILTSLLHRVKQSQPSLFFYTKSMNIYAIDFETYYDKEYSVVDLGYWHYTHHERFNAYMVSIVGDDGNEYAGDPKEFDWGCIHDTVWLSHNANFDAAVFERLKELGIVPAHVAPREWHDTADLVTYLGYPRSLKEAMAAIYKIEVNKSTRDNMTGKSWESMTPEFKQEVTEYALKDSRACVKLWADLSDAWPKHERELSRQTRTMCTNGLPIDLEGCEADIRALELKLWQARKLIPWADNEDAKVLSPKALAEECRKHGIRAPKSMAQDSPDFDLWKEEFSEKYPFAQAMSDYRRINAILLKFKTMRLRTRPNGHMGFGLKYFGAHTGRWSGDTGFNVQNTPRADLFEVNLRKRIVAPNGKTLVVCDLSNIEPRCMAILANDTEMLNALQSGIDVYEAHARATLGYTDSRPLKEGDPLLRQVSKVRCLAGTTPVLTDKGYFTVSELKNMRCLRVWDGIEWVDYDGVAYTGRRKVFKYKGEHFTEDHEVFTGQSTTRPIGEIFKGDERNGPCQILRRNTPSEGWADVWLLARFVGRSLSKEWAARSKRALRRLWKSFRKRLE